MSNSVRTIGSNAAVAERSQINQVPTNNRTNSQNTNIYQYSQTAFQERTGVNNGDVRRSSLNQQVDANRAAGAPRMDAASERELAKINPQMAERIRLMAADLKSQGVNVVVAPKGGMRTFAEQNELYAQGRTKPGGVVTNARGGESYHNYGLAVDIVPTNSAGNPTWNASAATWNKIGAAGEKQGLEWGGRWSKFQDKPHFQMTGGTNSAKDLLSTYQNGGLNAVWDRVNQKYPNVGGTTPATPTAPAAGGASINGVPNYGQADPRWGGEPYRLNPNLGNFAQNGCTVTAAAIAASWASGKEVSPSQANANWGATLGQFKAEDMSGRGAAFGNTFGAIGKNSDQAAQLLDKVKESVKSGHPVVLGISGGVQTPDGKGWGRHTVVATGVNANGELMVNDPATGKTQPLSAFKFNNFDMAQRISRPDGSGGTVSTNQPATPTAPGAPTTPATPSAPALPVPTARLQRGMTGEQVKQLQNALVKLGFMTQAEMNTGPGTFGPRTDRALRAFQAANQDRQGRQLASDGIYGPLTRGALEKAMNGAGNAGGTTPTTPTTPTSGASNLPTTVDQANQFFKTQFTSQWNPNGPNASRDCGPASLEMALEAAGLRPASHDQASINQARAAMGAAPGTSTNTTQIAAGAAKFGAEVSRGSGWDELDKALASGKTVVAAGNITSAYKSAFGAGAYGHSDEGLGHFLSVLGRSANGNYIVADPMSRNGAVEMSREQLGRFFTGGNAAGSGAPTNFVAINNPNRTNGTQPNAPANPTTPANPATPSNPGNVTVDNLARVPGSENLSREFKQKVIDIAGRLKMNPNHLMAIMSFESGIDPSRVNRLSGATGLIQFLPSTARNLGTSVEALRNMSPERQLDYVEKYLQPYAGKMNSVEDAYMAVFYPKAIGRSNDSTLFGRGTTEYAQNSGLDLNRDGIITKGEAAARVRQIYQNAVR